MEKIIGDIDISSLIDAKAALDRSLAQPENEFTRNSSIQCFEFTLELVWKTIRRVLPAFGEQASNARECFRKAVAISVIENPEEWFEFIELRNKSSHVYKESVAIEIYEKLPGFASHVTKVIDRLRGLK